MIRAITGLPGSGKTLSSLYFMMQHVLRGRMVATNIELLPACPFYDRVFRLDQDNGECPVFNTPCPEVRLGGKLIRPAQEYCAWWHYMPKGVVYFIDELDNYMDSMDFAKLSAVGDDARIYFKQHRKRKPYEGAPINDEIYYMVQNIENLWTRVRRQTQSVIVCEYTRITEPLLKKFPLSLSRFVRAEFASFTLTGSPLSEGYFSYAEAKEMFGWYRTDQEIGAGKLVGRPQNDSK